MIGSEDVDRALVAATAVASKPLYKSGHHAILPYSLYMRRLEEQRRQQTLIATTRAPVVESSPVVQQSNVDDSERPVLVYLPPFSAASGAQIADFSPNEPLL